MPFESNQSSPTATPSSSATPTPHFSPKLPILEKNADQTAQLNAPLSQKQQSALNRLFAGETDQYICQALKIDRKTLYTWNPPPPAFMAEMTRRNHEIWSDVVGDLRETVAE